MSGKRIAREVEAAVVEPELRLLARLNLRTQDPATGVDHGQVGAQPSPLTQTAPDAFTGTTTTCGPKPIM